MRSPIGAAVFAQVSGAASSDISIMGNSLEPGQKVVSYIDGAKEDSAKVV
jgi:hypothetical protein